MALIENDVIVTTKHGRMHAFAVCPDEPGAFPGIVFYMDAPGYREELKNHARRIAREGYFCILPNMYYRLGAVLFDLPRRDDAMSAVIRASMNSLTNALVTDDTAAILSYLDAQDKCKAGPVGCVGHCMSGQYITTVSAHFPTRFASAASLYGVGIVTEGEDSPHLLLDKVQGELYYAFAETDASVSADIPPKVQAALETAGTKHTLKVWPGTQHGYLFAERPAYAPVQSEQTWAEMFDLWKRTLK